MNIQKHTPRTLGEKVYENLELIPDKFQMVDIFRNANDVVQITREIAKLSKVKKIETIWMQLNIRSYPADNIAEPANLNIIMNRCPAIEIRRSLKKGI